ncbi:MarR family winged helix-turn-helix transcriptional regulator [Alteraurantiacibacter aquimixticola]|uniref:MarR family winged helix-turn-helix transcriptional regulator n=1 Tax=Alteraurantiacibacter aquimixticola TaxID=2489173 RepID=UPI00145ADABC|nr:MarR family transcriptional regulator [Alteraurantiacibacter aquimixticola]
MPFSKSKSSFEIYREGGSPVDVNLLVKMVLFVRGFRSKLDEELRKIDQSTSRMETLAAILNMPDPKSQSDIAKRLRIEGPTVTRMMDILSKEGLVTREPHPTDRRVNLVRITTKGEEELEQIFKVYDRLRNHVLAPFSREQIFEMRDLMDTMLGQLEAGPGSEIEIRDPRFPPIDDDADRKDR